MVTLSELLSSVDTGGSLIAVLVAIRALGLNRSQASRADTSERVKSSTTASVMISDLEERYRRMTDLLDKLSDRLLQHEKECIREKTVLTENLRVVSENLLVVSNRLDSWAQQAAFMARDKAVKETAERLGHAPRAPP